MSFSQSIRIRLIRRAALGLAVAAVVAPSAAAMGHGSLHNQEGAGPVTAQAYPPGALVESSKTFAYPPGALKEAPSTKTFAYPPGAVKEAPSTIDWRGIEVGADGNLSAVKTPSTLDLPTIVKVGPGGYLTSKNPVRLPIEVGPDGQLTAKAPATEAPVSYPVGAPVPVDVVVTPTEAPVSDTGFDWRIGVIAGLGALAAMVFGAMMLFSRRRGTLQGA